jgi:hypothetical protein
MIGALGLPSSELAASIGVTGERTEMAAQVSFFARGKPLGQHAYRMRLEPLADAKESTARIEAELNALGVRRHAATGDTKRVNEVCRVGRRSAGRRNRASGCLTIPL